MMDDEITECPLESSSEDGAATCAPDEDMRAGPGEKTNSAAKDTKTSSAGQLKASGAVPKAGPHGTLQILGFPRSGLKDQSQGAQAHNRNHRSAVRPFFCCGSEVSLVSLMDSVDLNGPGCGSAGGRVVMRDGKLSLSDSEEISTTDHLLPHSYSCTADLATVCGSGASVQTVCGTGSASGGSLVRRKKKDEQKVKKHFWSLSFRKKLPGGRRFSEPRKSACVECGSKKCGGSRGSSCGLICEKGKSCACQKVSYQCTATQLGRRKGRVVDRRASVAGMFPINGNDELLACERSSRSSFLSRARASCNVESLMRLNRSSVDDASLSRLTSRLQLNPGNTAAELPVPYPYQQYLPLMDLEEDMAYVHTRVDFIHHLVPDLKKITSCSFYWGVIDRYEAERLLDKKREGTFLLRDSAQEDFLFSVSFRRYNRSLHARVEQWNHRFSFDVHDSAVYSADSVCGLIEHYKDSSRCLFFEPMLTDPLHRTFPFSLQHLARAAISSSLKRYDDIGRLPLPMSMKAYLRYYHYKEKVCVRNFEDSPLE